MAAQYDGTLAGLGQQLVATRPWTILTNLRQVLPGLGWRHRKKVLHTARRDTERVETPRREFIEIIRHEYDSHFKFVDETSMNLRWSS